jgi:hydrogenase small subunit
VDAWPIGIGAPCIGCTEKKLAFRVPLFQVIPIHDAKPPEVYAPIESPQGAWSAAAAGTVGVIAGALLGAGYVASRKFSTEPDDASVPGTSAAGGSSAPLSERHDRPGDAP